MSGPEEPVAISRDYDYRYARPNQTHLLRAPLSNDTSLMTYVGHSVARTLLRARFSPIASTGQKYIVSASADGDIGMTIIMHMPCTFGRSNHRTALKVSCFLN